MTPSVKLVFEPSLVESAVFLALRRYEENGPKNVAVEWYEKRNQIYAVQDPQVRDKAFREAEEQWFRRLGIRARFEGALRPFALLGEHALTIHIRRAFARTDEGSELYIQGDRKTNVMKLRTMRLFEDDFLERFLRHEWLRISDMLDPLFQYSPDAALSGTSELEDNLIRDRYRLLWDLYISTRLLERGFEVLIPLEEQRNLIDKVFSTWTPPEREKTFREILNQKYRSQSDFLALATNEKLMVPLGQGGLLCPLCRFTSFDPLQFSPGRDAATIQEIQKDYPKWHVDLGICQNCFYLYRSKMRVVP